jgi:hypothetical protein
VVIEERSGADGDSGQGYSRTQRGGGCTDPLPLARGKEETASTASVSTLSLTKALGAVKLSRCSNPAARIADAEHPLVDDRRCAGGIQADGASGQSGCEQVGGSGKGTNTDQDLLWSEFVISEVAMANPYVRDGGLSRG